MPFIVRFTLVAAAAAFLASSQAQQVEQAASSRLAALVLDVLPAQTQVAAVETNDKSRLGSLLLAQIPPQPQPGIVPGQNPNTVRPIVRPGVTPKRGSSALAQPSAGTAGSPAPNIAPAPAAPPASSPVAAKPAAPAPQPQPATDAGATGVEEEVSFDYVNVPLPELLSIYGNLIGKVVIRDINLESVTFTLTTDSPLRKTDAIDFMERSLLLNGYGFLPAGEKFVKCVMLAQMKPGTELRTDLIYSIESLPQDGEEVVTFIQPLKHVSADDLQKTLQTLVPLHAYGVIQPLINQRGIAITENSNTIRYIAGLIEKLDVPQATTEKKTFQLERSSAEDVAKVLADILGLDKSATGGSSSGSKPVTPPQQQPQIANAGIPNQPGAQAPAAHTGVYGSSPQSTTVPPKLVPIARTNSLMVIASTEEIKYIGSLIEELDAASTIKKFVSYPLKYLDASSVLRILGDALQTLAPEGGEGSNSGGGSVLGSTGNNNQNNQQRTTGDFGRSNSSGLGSSGGLGGSSGFGSGYGSGGGSFGGGGGGVQALRQNDEAQSLVVGKTLLIADPTQNEIFVTGPPEHMDTVKMILDELDVRPRMVMLNAVIGSLTLKHDTDFGIDYIFRPTEVRFNKWSGNVAGTSGSRVGSNSKLLDTSAITALKDLTPLSSGLTLFGTFNDQVTVALSALNSNSDFKILSRPTLYTLNNVPASIQTGTKIPVPVSSLNSYNTGTTGGIDGGVSNGFVSNIQYQEVSLRLDVAPLIYSNDEIKLNVKQVNDTVAGSTSLNGNNIPNISTQGLETTILVKNNSTVLLGGLITDSTEKARNGIPFLRDVPLLKYVFSSTKDNKNRNELLIFISPRIVTGEGDEPPSATDSAGASPLGQEAQKFFNQERSDPAREIKEVRRTKIGKLLHKLFE